jgi:sulfate transport system permease protein
MSARAILSWAYVGLLIALPTGNLIYFSLKIGPAGLWAQVSDPDAVHALWLTVFVAVLAIIINTGFGVLLALTLARQKFRGRTAVSILTDVPLTMSSVVAGLVLLTLYRPEGWLGKPLAAGGIQILNGLPAIMIATLFVTLPLVTRELIPILIQVGTDQEEAAITLGASRWQTFWRITLPGLKHGLARGITLTFARAVGEFGAVVVVSGNLIGHTQTMTTWVYQESSDFNYAGAYAGSLILGILSVAAFALAEHARLRSTRKRQDVLTHIR